MKGGFQPERLKRAELPHWRGFLPIAAKAAWVGWGEPKSFASPAVVFPVSAGAPTALQLLSSFHTFGDSTNVY